MSYSIYNKYNNNVKNYKSYYKDNRIDLLPSDVAADFNTYRNWKEFNLAIPEMDENSQIYCRGVKSLFSNVAAVYTEYGDINK